MRQNHYDFIARLVEKCEQETRVMHLSNSLGLPQPKAQKYITLAMEKGFLTQVDKSPRAWLATKKGNKYLKAYEEMKKCYESSDIQEK